MDSSARKFLKRANRVRQQSLKQVKLLQREVCGLGVWPGATQATVWGFHPIARRPAPLQNLGLASVQIIVEPFVFHKHAFGRSPITNQTKTEIMKTVDKKNPMGAVIVIAIALAAWLPTTAGEL